MIDRCRAAVCAAAWLACVPFALAVGLQLLVAEVAAKPDFEAVFAAMRGVWAEAIGLPPEALILSQREAIAEFCTKQRLPGIPPLVDKILNGARAEDLPLPMPSQFRLVVNLRAAGQLGLVLPPALLCADSR